MEPTRRETGGVRKMQYGGRPGCGTLIMAMLTCTAAVVLCLTVSGCRTKNTIETQDTSDSVRIEYREKVVKVPVTVYVEVPVEQTARETRDSASTLETSFAVSQAAMIWIDGVPFLRHSLANKPQKIGQEDSVSVTEKEKVVWKTRRVYYTKTEIRERSLTLWQRLKVDYGGWAMVVLAGIICILLKRNHRT